VPLYTQTRNSMCGVEGDVMAAINVFNESLSAQVMVKTCFVRKYAQYAAVR